MNRREGGSPNQDVVLKKLHFFSALNMAVFNSLVEIFKSGYKDNGKYAICKACLWPWILISGPFMSEVSKKGDGQRRF